mmetsp:Transcript_25365/g.38451  ORF Transcript_25365/g.38451 Transcript_25365/m.38451 type:complete len:1326 (-) Transcript_25365:194-4171(-)
MRCSLCLQQVITLITFFSFLSTSSQAFTDVCSYDNTTVGYYNTSALETALVTSNETLFILCPNTTFYASNLTIVRDDTMLSCGSDVNVDNVCIIVSSDGEPIIRINEGVENIVVQGMTFEGVNESGTVSYYNSNSNGTVLFQECQWIEQRSQSCYNDLDDLQTALVDQEAGQAFVVCPESTLNLTGSNSSLIITEDNVTIQCGDMGIIEDKCTLLGGDIQVKIMGDGLLLHGLIFLESMGVSVLLTGNGTVHIDSCEWSSHNGIAVIMAYQGDMSMMPQLSLDQNLSSSTDQTSRLIIEGSLFKNNHVEMGIVTMLEGNISSHSSTFLKNSGSTTIYSKGHTLVENSCFSDNEATLPGEVVVAEVMLVEGNYSSNQGIKNVVGGLGDCFGIFAVDTVACLQFELAESCPVHNSSPAPSISPAGEPSLPSNGVISFQPSDDLLNITDTPSIAPSVSNLPSTLPYHSNQPSLSLSLAPSLSIFPSSSVSPTLLNNSETQCIFNWTDLSSQINSHDEASFTMFTLCSDTHFDFSAGELEPLKITSSNLILKCFDSTCEFSGGLRHIILEGSIQNVTIVGITFSDVEGVKSSTIYGNLSSPASITFQDCQWFRNKGRAVIELHDSSSVDGILQDPVPVPALPVPDELPGDDDDIFFRREMEDADAETSFTCNHCIFENNTVSEEILTATGVSLELSEVLFQTNDASESIVHTSKDDNFLLSSSCFFGNTYGSVLVNTNLINSISERNFGASNFNPSGLQSCNGLGDIATCETFDSPACSIDDNNAAMEYECYDNWSALRASLQNFDENSNNTFTLCENSVLFAEEHITIDSGDVSILCHKDSLNDDDNCTVKGNTTHFLLEGRASSSIRFQGISFEGSDSTSIKAFGSNNSEVIFINCTWKENGGTSAVLIYNEFDGALFDGQNIGNLSASSSKAMSAIFEFCEFTSNTADFATVAIVDGNITFTSTLFRQNSFMKTGAIACLKGTVLALFSSVFRENESQTAGTIFMDSVSKLEDHDANIFEYTNNIEKATECEGIFRLDNESCLIEGICAGSCIPFNTVSSPPSTSITLLSTSSPTATVKVPSIKLQKASLSAVIVINIIVIFLTIGSCIFACYKCHMIHNGPLLKKSSQDSVQSADASKVLNRKSSSQFTLCRIDECEEAEEGEEALLQDTDEEGQDSCSSFHDENKSASNVSLNLQEDSQRSLDNESSKRSNSRSSLISEARSSRSSLKKGAESESDLSFASYSNLYDEVVNDSYRSLVDMPPENQVKAKKNILKRAQRKVGKKISKIVTKDSSAKDAGKDTGKEDQPLYTDSDCGDSDNDASFA